MIYNISKTFIYKQISLVQLGNKYRKDIPHNSYHFGFLVAFHKIKKSGFSTFKTSLLYLHLILLVNRTNYKNVIIVFQI